MATISAADFVQPGDGNTVMIGNMKLSQDPVNPTDPATKIYVDGVSMNGCVHSISTSTLDFSYNTPDNAWANVANVSAVTCSLMRIGQSVVLTILSAIETTSQVGYGFSTAPGTFPFVDELPAQTLCSPVMVTADGVQSPYVMILNTDGSITIRSFGVTPTIDSGIPAGFNTIVFNYQKLAFH